MLTDADELTTDDGAWELLLHSCQSVRMPCTYGAPEVGLELETELTLELEECEDDLPVLQISLRAARTNALLRSRRGRVRRLSSGHGLARRRDMVAAALLARLARRFLVVRAATSDDEPQASTHELLLLGLPVDEVWWTLDECSGFLDEVVCSGFLDEVLCSGFLDEVVCSGFLLEVLCSGSLLEVLCALIEVVWWGLDVATWCLDDDDDFLTTLRTTRLWPRLLWPAPKSAAARVKRVMRAREKRMAK